jgi:hypothetical protein
MSSRALENLVALASALLLTAFICSNARAQEPAYPTVDEAAIAAEHVALKVSGDFEYGGAIYRASNGLYGFTVPQTNHDPFNINIRAKFSGTLVAIYHTHPGNTILSQEFSPLDKDTARSLKVPSYIGVVMDQTVRRYNPATGRSDRI